MSAEIEPCPILDYSPDAELENRIADQAIRLHTALTPDKRRTAWIELTRLHALRSPQQIERLESERGLR